ncbi:MAG: hypothetical protein KDA65_04335 [Planctomycetaceae bacterium]|nr:hypothetical protein [Planctomycetaceae bacterium]
MSSPFSYFRKYAKELTVALIGLSMFAFIVMDQLQPQNLPMVIGALIGGVIFFWVGKGSGRRTIYTFVGLVAGFIVGSQFNSFAAPVAPVTIQNEPMERQELEQLLIERNRANQFILTAQEEAMGRQAMQMQGGGFRFGFGLPVRQDVVLGSILQHIGDELKVAVTDDVVGDFISEITNDKMTREAFSKTLERMNVSGASVYESLRKELKAYLAYRLHVRHLNPTPSDYWDTFRKTQIRQELQVVPIEADKFIPLVNNDPKDSEIQQFFDQYKDKLPGELAVNSPGFMVPRKVNLEYLMADRDALHDELAAQVEVSDEEIEKFYEENKETYRNLNAFSGTEESPTGPEMTPPVTNSDSEKSPAAAEKPAEEAASESKPEEGEATPEESKPEESSAEEKPAQPEEEKTEPESQSSLPSSRVTALASVQDDPNSTPEETATPENKPEETSSEPAESTPSAEEEEKPAAEPATPEGEASSEETPKEPEYRPLDDELRAEIREQLINQKVNSLIYDRIEQAMSKMRNLSDKFQEQRLKLRDQITTADKEISLEDLTVRLNDELKPVRQELTQSLKELAKETGLVYHNTGLVNILELRSPEEQEKYNPVLDIGNSTEAAAPDRPFSANSTPVWYNVFQPEREPFYYPQHTSGTGLNNNQYAFWKTEDIAEHIPELDGDVRKEVIDALIKDRAKQPALDRAEAIAKLIQENEGKIAESIADQTITGEEGSEKLSFIPIDPFTWMVEVSARGQQSFMPQTQVQLNMNVEGLESVGQEFMQTTFDEMNVGDVRVVRNSGSEIFYVVKVVSREPTSEEEMDILYASFTESLRRSLPMQQFFGPSPYARSILQESQQVRQEYIQSIFDAYQVKFADENQQF